MLDATDRKPKRVRKELALIQLLPNALTLGAICAGLTAVRLAAIGSFQVAVALIILACVLDGLDGRLARALNSESLMGAELDSLADFLNFGVAPAIILYFWALLPTEDVGWAAALVYTLCCVLRLARFNVGMKSEDGNDKNFFQGVPSPAGALLVLGPLFLAHAVPKFPAIPPIAVAGYMALIGALMVSRLPSFSLKSTKIYADHAPYVLMAAAASLAALAVIPWITLTIFDALYLASLVFAFRASRALPVDADD